jgi:hypothetical protein
LVILAFASAGIVSYSVPGRTLSVFATAALFSVGLLALSLMKRTIPSSGSLAAIDSSRRSLLVGGVAALGAAGATIAMLPTNAGAKPGRKMRVARTAKLNGRNWRYRKEDGHGKCYGELVDGKGKKLGNFYSTNLGMNAPFDDDHNSSGMEFQVFSLTNGSIFGMGSGTHLDTQEGIFSVIGGTGSYAGQTGSYHGSQHSVELGGDGSAEFTFSLGR